MEKTFYKINFWKNFLIAAPEDFWRSIVNIFGLNQNFSFKLLNNIK